MSCSDWDTLAKWVKVGELSPKLKMYRKQDLQVSAQQNRLHDEDSDEPNKWPHPSETIGIKPS